MRALKLSEDIRPVTDLKSSGAEIIRHVEGGRTVVLSRHGRAVAVVLSVEEYEGLQDAADQLTLRRAVEEAEADIAQGRTLPHHAIRQKWASVMDDQE